MLCLRIVLLLFLASGTLALDELNLFDALDETDPTPAKPKEPKAPEKPKSDGGELDILDAFGPDLTPAKPKEPKATEKPKSNGEQLDLFDALGPDPEPRKPKDPKDAERPRSDGKGFSDSDLFDITGEYKPDGGRHGGGGGGGRAQDPGYNPQGGGDQPQAAGSGQIAGIVSTIGVALLGAASSYFAYQKKKLCFKMQGGQDPEMGKGHRGTQNDNQMFSNLLRTS